MVCDKQHAACTIYQTAAGPVAVYTRRTLTDFDALSPPRETSDGGSQDSTVSWRHPRDQLAVVLDEELSEAVILPQCRCSRLETTVGNVRRLLHAGKRRAII